MCETSVLLKECECDETFEQCGKKERKNQVIDADGNIYESCSRCDSGHWKKRELIDRL